MSESFVFNLPDEADTIRFGRSLAHIARKGDIFALYGTLGMGKSVLARAFIQELTTAKEVPSPTFTLMQIYEAPDFEIYHFDLYRVKNPDEIFEIGVEEAMYDGVCLIEWPQRMENYLPRNVVRLNITPSANGRSLSLSCSDASKMVRFSKLREDFDD